MSVTSWTRTFDTLMQQHGNECFFSLPVSDPSGPTSVSVEQLENSTGPPRGIVKWQMLLNLYKKSKEEKLDNKVQMPLAMSTLSFIKVYMWAGRVDRQLYNFEDDSMKQFLKEIYTVFMGSVMPFGIRRDWAHQMISADPARTRHVVDYMGKLVHSRMALLMQVDLEAFEADADEEESARKRQRTEDAASSAPSGAAP